MQNWEEIQRRLAMVGQPKKISEISSAEAGINTLEDLMNVSGGYSRSDPTLWDINGQQMRIDSKLYQSYADYNRAWRSSDIYQKYGIKESGQYKEKWTKNYLANLASTKGASSLGVAAMWGNDSSQQATIKPSFDIRKPNLGNTSLPSSTANLISQGGVDTVWKNPYFEKFFNK